MCVCVEVKYSLCGVREAVCQKGRGSEVGSRWTASPLAHVLCPHLLRFPALPLYLFIHLCFHTCLCHFFFLPSHLPLFPSLFLASTRWQHGATEKEKGAVERGGERRWRSGIWRAWLRGPLRGSVCRTCGSAVNRGGGRGRIQ